MENDDVLYLLGNWITHRQPDGSYTAGEYKSFHFFDRSDPAEEGRQLAAFWAWLHGMVDDARATGKTIAVYCYSGATAEITQMKAASLRNSDVPGVPTPEQIADLVHQPWWVDLLPVAKSFHWPARGHGLKELAKLTGFSWNADDASGGQSMVWYRAACDPLNPEAEDLQRKLLQYNTDDVRATLHLRNYLCEGIEGNSWTIHPVEVLPLS
jgi:predicted RecB family nuclease